MMLLRVFLLLAAAPLAATEFPFNPFKMMPAFGAILGLTGGGRRTYPFPAGAACKADLKSQCKSIVRVCETGDECNLECVATKPPTISAACQALHPCAKLAETLCVGVLGPKESILDCMKKHRAKLTPKCIRSEPCLQVGNPRCSSHHHHYMGNAFERNQLFGETHPNDKCSCGVSSPCSEHLNHPFCEPCGKDCVRNPQCGGGKTWCEVKSSSCNSALTHHMGECIGPYIGFPHCESEILHLIVKRHQISRMNADIDIRCSVQAELARMSPSKCPLPRKSLPGFLAQKRIRHCSTGPKHHHHPPLFGSFLRDIFGGARRESKLRHQRTALEKERVALALERRGMARERLERRSVDKELVHEIEASTAEAKKSKWEARAAEAKARMFNAEARLKEASTFDHPEKAQESQVRQQEALQSAVEAEHGFSRFVDFRSAAPTRHSACLVGIALTTILALWLGQ